jgi:uncharacterized protein YkwD
MNGGSLTRTGYVVAAVLLGACAGSGSVAPHTAESLHVGSANGVLGNESAPATMYSTSTHPGGVEGGQTAATLAEQIQARLRERGDAAEPDGALASAAVSLLREAAAGGDVTATRIDLVARRFGFAGVVPSSGVARLDDTFRETLEQLVQSVPGNMPVTHFGIIADESVRGAAILLGNVEATLAPFPRTVSLGASIHLEGEVAKRFDRASLFVTSPAGAVRETAMPSRHIDANVELAEAGTYGLEIMGYGKSGPTVLVNVPIYAGTVESFAVPETRPPAPEVGDAEHAEPRLFELTNEARRRAGVPRLALDPALHEVALQHSLDMVQNNFQGHISPSTGGPADRVRRAGIQASIVGENLGSGTNLESIHEGLLGSPAHRAALLRPDFTHLGIGVVLKPQAHGRPLLVITELFARRPPGSEARLTQARVLEEIQRARAAAGLPRVEFDSALSRAAQSGLGALSPKDPGTRQRAMDASFKYLQAEVNRTRQNRPPSCGVYVEILEGSQLAQFPFAVNPKLHRIGIGLLLIEEPGKNRLALLLIGEGTPASAMDCK